MSAYEDQLLIDEIKRIGKENEHFDYDAFDCNKQKNKEPKLYGRQKWEDPNPSSTKSIFDHQDYPSCSQWERDLLKQRK